MEETINKLKYLINKKKDFLTVCKELELKDYEVIGLVKLLHEQGENIDYVNGEIIKLRCPVRENDIYLVPADSEYLKLCLISDTHLCSKYDRLDILNYIYEKAEKNGVKHILHSGDFTDGRSNRPEHVYELKEISYDGQVDYCVDKYPKSQLIKTYAIQGNHDNWWYKSTGSEIIRSIAKRRDDIVYLGTDYADVKIGKVKIRMFHGSGGAAYSKSYKLQKYVDTIAIKDMPHILQTGHIHQSFYMKQDKTHCFQTSSLEDLTPFAKSIGAVNDKSCWWLDIYCDSKGNILSIQMELESFEKVRKR